MCAPVKRGSNRVVVARWFGGKGTIGFVVGHVPLEGERVMLERLPVKIEPSSSSSWAVRGGSSSKSTSSPARGDCGGVRNVSDSSASLFGGGGGTPETWVAMCVAMTTSSVVRRGSCAPINGGKECAVTCDSGGTSGPETSMAVAAGKSAVGSGVGTGPVPKSCSIGVGSASGGSDMAVLETAMSAGPAAAIVAGAQA
eukprot:1434229-Amphidinium_carterae.1